MKKGKLNLDKHSRKSMRHVLVSQGIFFGACLVNIVLCLIFPSIENGDIIEHVLFLSVLLLGGTALAGIPMTISNFFISLAALPTERGKKRTLWILWMVLAPILGFVLFLCSGGLFVVATGGV